MLDVTPKVTDALQQALVMTGLDRTDIARAMDGASIYGERGMLDSMGLVRLIGGVSLGFEDLGIDMFDMLEALDANPAEVFADRPSIVAFASRVLGDLLVEGKA